MVQRKPVIAGNWKMNGLRASLDVIATLQSALIARPYAPEVIICPPATLLGFASDLVKKTALSTGGQDCHEEKEGAYTGAISAPMLKDMGASYVILGHSERRHGLGETDTMIAKKIRIARDTNLVPILCVGETREEWSEGLTLATVETQVRGALHGFNNMNEIIIAYEPVWAIGSGETPTPEAICSVHKHINKVMNSLDLLPPEKVRVIYGGSVKPDVAGEILKMDEVDGALVGGASLKADDFLAIIDACPQTKDQLEDEAE